MESRNFCTFAFPDYFSKNLKRVRFQNLDRTIYGIDEAWLDVSDSGNLKGSGMTIAREISSAIIFPIVKIVLKISTVGKGSLLLGTTGEGRRQKKCYYNYALSHIHKPGRKNPASEAVYAKLLIIL